MRKDLLNDLCAEERVFNALHDMLRDEDMLISELLRDAPWYVLRDDTEDDGNKLPLTERLSLTANGREDHPFEKAPINTCPFGKPTTQVFPEFLGICSAQIKFREVLNAARSYCKKARNQFPWDQPKTVMIFTDKWDWALFQKEFELPFLHDALENNVLFIFLLVTDYGVCRIPFLGGNHGELARLRRRNYNIESEHPGVSALAILKQGFPCTYECHSGTWARYGSSFYYDLHYSFDFRAMRCTITGDEPKTQIKAIPAKAAQEFAGAVYEFLDQCGGSYADPNPVLDAGQCLATVGNVSFLWYGAEIESLDQPCQKIAKAFDKLIGSLKEVRRRAQPN